MLNTTGQRTNQILRDYLIVEMRTAARPLTTAELCRNAPPIPVAGMRRCFPPTREHIYRLLLGLRKSGTVTSTGRGQTHAVSWSLEANEATDREIVTMETLFAQSQPSNQSTAP